jgi:hypothetical protein
MTNQNGRGRNTFFNPNKVIVNGGTCLFEKKKKTFRNASDPNVRQKFFSTLLADLTMTLQSVVRQNKQTPA